MILEAVTDHDGEVCVHEAIRGINRLRANGKLQEAQIKENNIRANLRTVQYNVNEVMPSRRRAYSSRSAALCCLINCSGLGDSPLKPQPLQPRERTHLCRPRRSTLRQVEHPRRLWPRTPTQARRRLGWRQRPQTRSKSLVCTTCTSSTPAATRCRRRTSSKALTVCGAESEAKKRPPRRASSIATSAHGFTGDSLHRREVWRHHRVAQERRACRMARSSLR